MLRAPIRGRWAQQHATHVSEPHSAALVVRRQRRVPLAPSAPQLACEARRSAVAASWAIGAALAGQLSAVVGRTTSISMQATRALARTARSTPTPMVRARQNSATASVTLDTLPFGLTATSDARCVQLAQIAPRQAQPWEASSWTRATGANRATRSIYAVVRAVGTAPLASHHGAKPERPGPTVVSATQQTAWSTSAQTGWNASLAMIAPQCYPSLLSGLSSYSFASSWR